MIFLLDALAQVLDGHVFLRQLDLDGSALLLEVAKAPAFFAESFLAAGDFAFLRLLLTEHPGGLCVYLFALVTEALDLQCGLLYFQLRLFLARDERAHFRPAL